MPRTFLLLAASLLASACATTTVEPMPGPAPAQQTASPAAPEVHAPPAEPASPIGWAKIPPLPTADARAHNRRGLSHHRAGEYEQSLAAFDESLAADPSYAWARYNRACALARLGRFEPAMAELERLLAEDLPRFGPRIASDDDLETLRESDHGRELEHLQSELAAAYRAAIDEGVSAWIYRPRDQWSEETGRIQRPYTDLRMGVWLPKQRRFVPLSPDIDEALAGYIDRHAERLLMISGKVIQSDMWVVQPVDIGIELFDLAALGQPLNAAQHIDRRRDATKDVRHAIAAAVEGDAVRLTYSDLGYAEGGLTLMIEANKTRQLARTWEIVDEQSEAKMRRLALEHVGREVVHLWIDGHGVQFHRPMPDLDLDQAIALPGDPLRYEPTSHRVAVTTDRRFALSLRQYAGCWYSDEGALTAYSVHRTELESGVTTLLFEGEGMAGAELGPDGSAFVDDGRQVLRFAPDSNEPLADVAAGVHFALPPPYYDCSI